MKTQLFPALMSCLIAAALPASASFLPGKTGEKSLYRLSYAGDGTLQVRGMLTLQTAGADRVQTKVDAQLEIVQISSTLLSARLLSPDHRILVNGQAQDLKSEQGALERGCYITVDALGRIQSVSFASTTPILARSLMRSLLSGLEFAQPQSTSRDWKLEQDTSNGIAQASYRTLDVSLLEKTVEKRIVSYRHQREIGPKGMPQMRPASQGSLRFRFRQGHLQDVSGVFSTRFTLADRELSQGSEQFQLTRMGAQAESAEALRLLSAEYRAQCAAEAPTALHAHDTDAEAQRASWATLLKGATAASLLADLSAVDAKGAANDSKLYSRLCALFTLQPQTSALFEQALAGAQPNRLSTRLVVAALAASAGGSQAANINSSTVTTTIPMQAAGSALCGVLASHKDQPDMVILVAPALGMMGAPNRETEKLLESLAGSADRDIAISCALALGGIARHGSPALAKEAIGFLQRKLASADVAISMQPHLLASLGNAGSAQSYALLAAYTRKPSAQLRAAAYMSLRMVPGEQASKLLYRGLHDSDPDVRVNAARAFEFRPFAAADIQLFTRLIAAEKADRVRLALLENLKLEAPYYPGVHTVLQKAATQDASTEIRKAAAGWML